MYFYTYQLAAVVLLIALLMVGTYLIWTLTKDRPLFTTRRKRG